MMEIYENTLVFFLGHYRPETLISASFTYFHDSLHFSLVFYVFCPDLIDFNLNSWFYISILIHGFNRGRGELRLGRVSGELTSGECDEIDGNAADDKRR